MPLIPRRHQARQTLRRWPGLIRCSAAGLALGVVTSALATGPATAATLSEQRADLRQVSYAAAENYVDSRPFIAELARARGLALKGAIEAGTASLKEAGNALTAATTQSAMDAVAVQMDGG